MDVIQEKKYGITAKTNIAAIGLCILLIILANINSGIGEESNPAENVGILVMAHGGKPEWNAAVEEAVAPLKEDYPTAIAFGMADPKTLQEAVAWLEDEGVKRIVVVRLFVSGKSFLHQTEYLLGLRPDAPAVFVHHGNHSTTPASLAHPQESGSAHHASQNSHHNNHSQPIKTNADFVLSQAGLLDTPISSDIIADRVEALSNSPENESLLILAHGPGSDEENEYWIAKMDKVSQKVKEKGAFRAIRVETLREDWPEKRKTAEQRIREFVMEGNLNGGRVIVVPFRVFGFGPYEEVLEGLNYEADGRGLLPHPAVTEWIRNVLAECITRAGW